MPGRQQVGSAPHLHEVWAVVVVLAELNRLLVVVVAF
jgi:hypothetical protein